jgi:peptidoglycan hydrolase-like protein with peptidoglycan-binding domain
MFEFLKNLLFPEQERGTGALLNPVDLRDIPISAFQDPVEDIPRTHFTNVSFLDINDQKSTGSCVGQAMAKMVEYYEYTKHKRDTDVSARFIYGMSKLTDGYSGSGTYPRNAAKILKKYGAATTNTCPDDATGMNDEQYRDIGLTGAMLSDAIPRKIEGYASIDLTPDALRQAIYKNGVITITLRVGDWKGVEVYPYRKNGDLGRTFHYVMVYGYDEDEFHFMNSWGKDRHESGEGRFYFGDFVGHMHDALVYTEIPEDLLEKVENQDYVFTSFMKIGMRSDEIKELQKRLNIKPVDGIFGPITKKAVIEFQKANGLYPDGLVGRRTRSVLNGEESPLISAIIEVESGGKLNAVGDLHLEDKAYGPMQIRQPAVDDVNKANGTDYKAQDMLGNKELSIWVFNEYMKLYAQNESPEVQARVWNGGPNGPNVRATEVYWEKVKKALGR